MAQQMGPGPRPGSRSIPAAFDFSHMDLLERCSYETNMQEDACVCHEVSSTIAFSASVQDERSHLSNVCGHGISKDGQSRSSTTPSADRMSISHRVDSCKPTRLVGHHLLVIAMPNPGSRLRHRDSKVNSFAMIFVVVQVGGRG